MLQNNILITINISHT